MHYELTNTNVVGNAIIRRYFQYLRLERSYTPNTLDAYLKDLQKLLNYYADEGIDFRKVTLEQLDKFAKTLRTARQVRKDFAGAGRRTAFCGSHFEWCALVLPLPDHRKGG